MKWSIPCKYHKINVDMSSSISHIRYRSCKILGPCHKSNPGESHAILKSESCLHYHYLTMSTTSSLSIYCHRLRFYYPTPLFTYSICLHEFKITSYIKLIGKFYVDHYNMHYKSYFNMINRKWDIYEQLYYILFFH